MPQWELLVTEGHARAARWRNVVRPLFALGAAAVILGVLIAWTIPEAPASTRVADAKAAYAELQRSAVDAFMQRTGDTDAAPAGAARAPSPEAASRDVAVLLATLNDNGRLPAAVTVETPETFWQGGWEPGTLHAVRKGPTVVIGQLVNLAPAADRQPPALRRSYALLRRGTGGQWQSFCLAVSHAASCDAEAIDPVSILDTMRPLLPRAAFTGAGA